MVDNDNKSREKRIVRVTLWGSVANALLLAFKFVAGIMGNSSAMIADAVHSFSDFITDVIVLFFVNISAKPRDNDHDYGHGRYETLATCIIGLFLLFVGFGILWNGVYQIYGVWYLGKELESPGIIALIAAIISIVVKEILYQYTNYVGKQVDSPAVIANAWHHRSDAFSSIGTLLGIGGAILLGEPGRILDPLAAIIVSFFILKIALVQTSTSISELLDKSLPKEIEDEILSLITEEKSVSSPHNLYTRRLGNTISIEVHIRVPGEMNVAEAHAHTRNIEDRIRLRFGENTHIMLHVEPEKT